MALKRVEFKVSMELPPDATVTDAREYIKDAVWCHCGSLRPPYSLSEYDPGDPMFELKCASIKVTRLYR